MNDQSGLTCPKCGGAMRAYERNGVNVDQCADCRGIFLDRGELERLTEAEGSYYSSAPAQVESRGGGHHGSSGSYGKRRKESFLGDLFG